MNRTEADRITAERLRELLAYDPDTGLFVWLVTRKKGRQGAVAGLVDSVGYRIITLDGHPYRAHRLAWFYMHGEWPQQQIDHINGVKDDNRITNLRDVSQAVNQHNRHQAPRSNVTTGVLGVCRLPDGRFKAKIVVDGKNIHLGYFAELEPARQAYLAAKALHHPTAPLMRSAS